MACIKAFPSERPNCTQCNKNLAKPTGNPLSDGRRYYSQLCMGCTNIKNHGSRKGLKKQWHKPNSQYKKYKKDHCESCGFKAKHSCQLDVDHIDGNRKNNKEINLMTLCANCHRLKTQQAKDCWAKEWRSA